MKKSYLLLTALLSASCAYAATMHKTTGHQIDITSQIQGATRIDITLAQSEGQNTLFASYKAALKTDEAWQSLGMATYTDAFLTDIAEPDPNTWQVEIQVNKSKPGYFRLVKPYAHIAPDGQGNDLYIHAEDPDHVYIDPQPLGFGFDKGDMEIGSIGGAFLAWGASISDIIMSYGDVFGTYDGHLISFPDGGLYYKATNESSNTTCNTDGRFRITMPDSEGPAPGHSAKTVAVVTDQCAAEGLLKAGVVAEGDYHQLRLCVLRDRANIADNLFELIANSPDAIAQTTVEAEKFYNITVQPDWKIGTLLTFAVDAGGRYIANSGSAITFITTYAEEGKWKPIGTGYYTDDIIASVYKEVNQESFEVDVELSTEGGRLYRVPNPYKKQDWSEYGNINFCENHDHYLYIDASNPESVRIPLSGLGTEYTSGQMYVCDRMTYDPDDENASQYAGRFNQETHTITFPVDALVFGELNDPKLYTANRLGAFSLTVPKPISIDLTDADTPQSKPRYFNLQGIEVPHPVTGQMYICVQGGKVSKQVGR